MRTTGQILKENRERKGITLNEVSLATKISVKVLQAIEEGDAEKLPTKTFLRGFVRAYARYLNLDEEQILSSFYEEMGSTKPKINISPDAQKIAGEAPISNKAPAGRSLDDLSGDLVKKASVVGAILVLVIAIVLLKNKADDYRNETIVVEPPKDIAAISPTPTPSEELAVGESPSPTASPDPALPGAVLISPTPVATPVVSVTATPTAIPKPTASPTATPKPAPSPTATPTPKPSPTPLPKPTATPAPSPKPSPKPTAAPTTTPKPAPTASPAAAAASPSPTPLPKATREVIIEALKDVEVEAQIDNEPTRKINLRADSVQAFKVNRKVILRFSDGGAVNLIVNGKDRGIPGDLGKPVRVELP